MAKHIDGASGNGNGNGNNGATKKRSDNVSTATVVYVMVLLFFALSILHFGSLSSRLMFPSHSSATPSYTANDQDYDSLKGKSVIRWDPQTYANRVPSNLTCDRSHYHYDICSINGPTVLEPTTSTFFAIGPTTPTNFMEKIRPLPRKWENFTMAKINEVTLVSGPQGPTSCDVMHNASALVFSAGGYTGNFFHEFNEGFLPLFITVQSMSFDRDIVLVIEKSHGWWFCKYVDLLHAFSKHPIVDLDNDNATHCFTSTTVGLVSHGFMTINPNMMPKPTTLVDFHDFLDRAYRKAHNPILQYATSRPKLGEAQNPIPQNATRRPTLVLVSRSKGVGRVLLNQAQVQALAENLGFNVVVFEPKSDTPVSEAYRVMNESHAMLGVHGAAMTHLLFLRPGSSFIQIVPIGTDEIAELCYGKPAKEMGLNYFEYKVKVEESSLIQKYHKYDQIIADPKGLQKKGWSFLKKVYLTQQDVKLDLYRFRPYLKKAYRKAKRFMKKVG